jgi:type I restriction enzyme S subunit
MSTKAKPATKEEEEKPALVPRLRFPEFRGTNGWTLEAGDALFDQISDRSPEPGMPVLAITQEHGAIPRHMIDYHVSVTEKSVSSYKVVRCGDFIISLRSFQGGIEYSRYHGICSPAYVILRRRGEGSDEYFRHYLKTVGFIRILTRNLEGLRDGKMVSYAQFSELTLPVPTSAEQQTIADCLSSVDELMAAQARKVDALKTHKKGLMQQLFPREGETQPRLRFPEFQNAGEWDSKPLVELGEIITGKTPSTKEAELWGGDILFITPTDISEDSKYQHTTARTVVETKSTKVLPEGSIVYTCIASIGKMALTVSPSITNQQINAVVPNSRALGEFLYYALANLTPWIKTIPATNTLPIINKTDFSQIAILHPEDKSEQQRIASCLSSLDALITAETQKHEALKTHKKGLMQQLFPSPEEVEE